MIPKYAKLAGHMSTCRKTANKHILFCHKPVFGVVSYKGHRIGSICTEFPPCPT